MNPRFIDFKYTIYFTAMILWLLFHCGCETSSTEATQAKKLSDNEVEYLLKNTMVHSVKLPIQSYDERIAEIEKIAKSNGLEKLSFQSGKDDLSKSRMFGKAPEIDLNHVSLHEIIIHSLDISALYYVVRNESIIFLHASVRLQ